jgi:hypothetical protein
MCLTQIICQCDVMFRLKANNNTDEELWIWKSSLKCLRTTTRNRNWVHHENVIRIRSQCLLLLRSITAILPSAFQNAENQNNNFTAYLCKCETWMFYFVKWTQIYKCLNTNHQGKYLVRNTVFGIVHCLRYIKYTRRFGSFLYYRLQVIGCHCTDSFFFLYY